MRKVAWLLSLLLCINFAIAQTGTLRVTVYDEQRRPVPSIVRILPQLYEFCNPWHAQTLSQWHSLFLHCASELGREPSLREWHEWMVKFGLAVKEQVQWLTDESGVGVWSLRPEIYSVYAWAPGYGVACAHHVVVRPKQTTEVTLTLPRVPITLVRAQLLLPWSRIGYAYVRLSQNGQFIPAIYLLARYFQLPLSEWHPRAKRDFTLGEFTVVFEADGMAAERSFRIERWGEIVDLGEVKLEPKPPREERRVPITIQVFWSDRKTPAAGVAVYWSNTRTDKKGRIQLELPLGGHEVDIRVPQDRWSKGISSIHWVYITPNTKKVTLVLPKPAKVQGTVRYEDGTPAVNAEVGMSLLTGEGGGRILSEPSLSSRTNEKGKFNFATVPPGKFVLRVWDGMYYERRLLTVREGETIQVTIMLPVPLKRQVFGDVKLPSGQPAEEAAIVMLGKTLFSDSQGHFEFHCPPGEEAIFFWLPGKGAAWRWLTIPPSKEPLSLSVTLENGSVTGQLVDEQDQPVKMAVVKLSQAGLYFTGLLAAHTDENGRFTISPVPSGKWQLLVEGYPSEKLSYPLPALVKEVNVPPNGVVDVGTLRVSSKIGRIVGRVEFPSDFGIREGEREAKISLCLPEKLWLRDVRPSEPQFECPLPAPGVYWLLAQGGGWSSEPLKVVVPETGGKVSVTLPLKRAGSVKVTVRSAKTNKPLPASVQIVNADGLEIAHSFCDCEGEAWLENIPPGEYFLRVWRPLHRTAKIPITVKAGEVTEAKITLEPKD